MAPSLPLEIWQLICDSYTRPWTFENSAGPIKHGDTYIHGNDRKEGLRTLSLVSKGISRVAQEHLFRWVEVGNQAGVLLCFVRAIINNPRLLLVPNVTQMRLVQACAIRSAQEEKTLHEVSQCFPSGVRHLDLELCNFEEQDFAVLMQNCTGLETFAYVTGGPSTSESNDEISVKGVVTHLRLCKESLRRVTIDMLYSQESDRDGDVGLDDFRDFPLLTQVVINGKALCGKTIGTEKRKVPRRVREDRSQRCLCM